MSQKRCISKRVNVMSGASFYEYGVGVREFLMSKGKITTFDEFCIQCPTHRGTSCIRFLQIHFAALQLFPGFFES